MTRGIVVGAGMAGLVTARVLSRHVDRVTVLERDGARPDDAEPRGGVPQGWQLHVLLQAGLEVLEGLFPGFTDHLRRTTEPFDYGADLAWRMLGRWNPREPTGLINYPQTRPLLEAAVSARTTEDPKITIRRGVRVDDLLLDARRVVGVQTDDGPLEADLVVDCSGRRSRLPDWIAAGGFPTPPEARVDVDIRYVTGIFERPAGWAADWRSLIISPHPPDIPRGGVIQPLVGGRWLVTAWGYGGDHPPTDHAGFLAFTRSLAGDQLYAAIADAPRLRKLRAHRFTHMRWRRFDQLKRHPAGVVALGDAVCSVDPVFGHGMSLAALEARALDRALKRHGVRSPKLPRAHYRACLRVVRDPWNTAAVDAFRWPEMTGDRPAALAFQHRYGRFLTRRACESARDYARMVRVMHLMKPPASLLSPGLFFRYLWRRLRGRA